MASYREGRPRTSAAWDHFEIQDSERGIATCNLCHDSFSFKTSVSNLMKHLRAKHGYTIESLKDEVCTDNEGDEKSNQKQKIKSEIYQYYEIKHDTKQATCSICLEGLTYASDRDLVSHLNTKHSIVLKDADEKSDDETDGDKMDLSLQQLSESRSGRSKSSAAWEYFDIKDDNRKVASCNLCGALCSYRTSVSNLMKHVKRKHDIGRSDDDDEGRVNNDERDIKLSSSMSRAQRSIVWLYFKCVDPESKLSQCLICKKLLSHSTTLTNLKKHLARKHPNVKIPAKEDGRKRILLSSGGELYEVETESKVEDEDDDEYNDNQDTMEMDTVFLEDFDALDEQATKKRKISKNTSKPSKKDYSSSSEEEEITFMNRYVKKPSDSFDHFGKYIASLLRKLPKDASSQLQADFVKQIMSVKVDKEFENFDIDVPK